MKKFDLQKTLLFERTFEVIKIGLYSSCVSSVLRYLDLFDYVNNSTVQGRRKMFQVRGAER